MEQLKSLKLIVSGIIGLIIICGGILWYGYSKGRESVYKELAQTPVETKIIIKHDTLPPLPPIIKRLRADTIRETPEEVLQQIDSLNNDFVKLKALLSEKAKPFETKMDSAWFYLHILTYPWSRENDIKIQRKAIPYEYPEKTNMQIIVKDPPWWKDVLKIGGGVLVGYGLGKIK
jgi:hypothetical protein